MNAHLIFQRDRAHTMGHYHPWRWQHTTSGTAVTPTKKNTNSVLKKRSVEIARIAHTTPNNNVDVERKPPGIILCQMSRRTAFVSSFMCLRGQILPVYYVAVSHTKKRRKNEHSHCKNNNNLTTNENPSQMKSFDEKIAATAPTIVVCTTGEKWQKNKHETKKKTLR